jgi:saccharopine dehydrogenase-like NADP-dependent oxidoreductase
MTTARAVLLVGATGAFGERLAEGLVRSGIHVIGIARETVRLEALATRLGSLFTAEAMDRGRIDADYIGDLRRREPGLFAMADASGPFQTSDYRLPQAAIRSGLHYVDLADARAFVQDITKLQTEALAANVTVLAGTSSTPALSHAVLDTLVVDTSKVIAIDVSISPGNRAPRGLSVVQAILSTVGQPIRVFRGGQWVNQPGWGLGKTIQIGDVGPRRVALCETPDLDLLVERYRPTADAIFRAGLELRLLHTSVKALSLLVRTSIVRSLLSLARPLRSIADLFGPFGTDRGGMRIDALVANTDANLSAEYGRSLPTLATAPMCRHFPLWPH